MLLAPQAQCATQQQLNQNYAIKVTIKELQARKPVMPAQLDLSVTE